MAKEEIKEEKKEEVKEEKKVEKTEENKKETTWLIVGLVSCVLSFLGILILPVSIIGLVKATKCPGNSSTKVAAIIFNILGMVFSILVTIVLVFVLGVFGLAFKTFDTVVDRSRNIIEEKDYDYDYDYGYDYDDEKDTFEDDGTVKTIGNSKFGYLEVPGKWEYDTREEKTYVVYSGTNNDDEIMLDILDSKTIEDAYSDTLVPILKAGNPVDIKKITINGKYEGYSIEKTGLNNEKDSHIYLFKTEDDVIRTITISSDDIDSKLFDVYNTYDLKGKGVVS